MNSSLASPAMSILKKCVARTTVRSSNKRLLKLKLTKSCHEIGKALNKRSYSKLNPTNLNRNTQESLKVNHDAIGKSSTILNKYSKSVDILQILRKPKINLQQDVEEKVSKVSADKKVRYKYNESKELSPENLSDDKLRIRLNYEKLNLNPAGNAKVSDELYKRFSSNLKHNKKKYSKNLDEVDSSTNMPMRNLYEENLQMIYNKKQLLDMMNTDQENYQMNRRKLRETESLQRKSPSIDVRDLLLNKEIKKSQLTTEIQNNKQYFARKVVKDQRLAGYKTANERRKNTGEFEQFKKKLERKFFRNMFFKEDTPKENTSGLLKHKHNFYTKDRSLNTYKSKSDKNVSSIHRNHNIRRSKSLDSFSYPSQPLYEKSADFFNKFQLKQVDGRRSDMTKYFMEHRANVENLSEKLDSYYEFPAAFVPTLKHGNILEPSEIVENVVERNIDTKKAKRILKFRNFDDTDYSAEEPQYVLCIKD